MEETKVIQSFIQTGNQPQIMPIETNPFNAFSTYFIATSHTQDRFSVLMIANSASSIAIKIAV